MELFYIGEKKEFDEKLVKRAGITFYGIHAGKLRRYFDFRNLSDLFKLPIGAAESLKILWELKPDLVFAKGGYVSVPVCVAAWLLRIPIWLHESDVSPGLATKICSRFADKIFVSFEESKDFFKHKNIEVVGNPIREFLLKGGKEKGYKFTGFSEKMPVVLIMGGSTGAQSLNKMVEKVLPELLKHVQVVHITGDSYISPPDERGGTFHNSHYKQLKFLNEELADVYAISDVVVSRAGSGSIFELLALKKPMILIPLPTKASRGDQIENALVFAQRGWARVIHQDKSTPEDFLKEILYLLNDKKAQARMIESQKKADFSNAACAITNVIASSR